MISSTYSLPWKTTNTRSSSSPSAKSKNDSAFDEHEYSNTEYNTNSRPSSVYASNGRLAVYSNTKLDSVSGSPCPDYEEVAEKPSPVRDMKGLVYNLASEGIFRATPGNGNGNSGGSEVSFGAANDPATKEKIMQSRIYCIHKDEGCKWSGALSKLKGHLNTCQKDAVACLNQCGSKIARLTMEDHMLTTCSKRLVTCPHCKKEYTGSIIEDHKAACGFEPVMCELKCSASIARNRLRAHQVNTCSKRLVSCGYCAKQFTADTLQAHHRLCRLFPVPCPNRCEAENITREEVENHLREECSNTKDLVPVSSSSSGPCQFSDAGCSFQSNSRASMDDHLRAHVQNHLDLMCRLVHRQSGQISKLTGQLERAHTSFNGILMWKIKDFRAKLEESRSSDGLELVSVPFYTSQNGYRLQASLFLNGNGGGEGTHISAYIKLLPGEFDGILRWPFMHTVSFSLLDQGEDRTRAVNIVESFLPDPSWPNFQRPSSRPDQLGFGFPKFVPHDMLPEREYVKEDCIFIKIRVDANRNVAV